MENLQVQANSIFTGSKRKYTSQQLAEIERVFESLNVEELY